MMWRPRVVRASGSSSSRSGLRKLSRGFSVARRPSPDASLSGSVVFWTASVEPVSLWNAPRLFLLRESSTTVGRVHCGGSDPLSSLLSRRRGSTLSLSVCLSSISPTPPPLTRTPRSCGSGGSHLVCLHHNPH